MEERNHLLCMLELHAPCLIHYIIDIKKSTTSDQLLLVSCVLGVLRTEVGPPFHYFSLLFHTLLPMSLRVNLVGGLRERH